MINNNTQRVFESRLASKLSEFDKKGIDRDFLVKFVNVVLDSQARVVASNARFRFIDKEIFNVRHDDTPNTTPQTPHEQLIDSLESGYAVGNATVRNNTISLSDSNWTMPDEFVGQADPPEERGD